MDTVGVNTWHDSIQCRGKYVATVEKITTSEAYAGVAKE